MITTILLSLATLAPAADTPTEPITSDIVTLGTTMPDGIALCDTVAGTGDLVDQLSELAGPDFGILFKDMAVDYFADTLEDGMGANYAMTAEAEVVFETWVTGCLG